jgi:hypothetical protein
MVCDFYISAHPFQRQSKLYYSRLQKGWRLLIWENENKQNTTDPKLGFALLEHDRALYLLAMVPTKCQYCLNLSLPI